MKKKILLVLVLLISSILLSGCLNRAGGPVGHDAVNGTPAASAPATAEKEAATAASTTAAPAPAEPFAVINLAAKNIAFNVSTITVPAGANVTVNFDNQDARVPHNFAVYETDAARKAVFQGKIINGPARIAYSFMAPEVPGTYFFRCDLHPTTMTGRLIVTPTSPVYLPMQQSAAAATPERQSGAAGTAAALPSPAPGQGQKVLVEIRGYTFDPDAFYVPAGTTVVWRNLDSVQHTVTSTVTSAGGRFDSGIIEPAGNFSHLFQEPGTYDYLCLIHPSMKARVVVLPAGASGGAPAGVGPSEVGSTQSLSVGTMASTISTTSPEQPTKVIVDLLAKDMNFDKDKITVIAGSRVYINFVNLDTGVPHNFAVYTGPEAENSIFQGQVVIGPGRIVYAFDAPVDTGIYFFRCDVHPKVMTGDLYVVSSDNLQAPEAGASASQWGGNGAEIHGAGSVGQGASPTQTNAIAGTAAVANESRVATEGIVPEGVTFDLIAENVAFDLKTMVVPAGARVTVNFNNRDSGVPHNFAVYENASAKAIVFRGKIVTGPGRITYSFDAPQRPGNYLFRCDVHPVQMTGQLVVEPVGTTPAPGENGRKS